MGSSSPAAPPQLLRTEPSKSATVPACAAQLFRLHLDSIYRHTDRLFAWLLLAQWLVGILTALWVSPLAWAGSVSRPHIHLWGAVVGGGLIISWPVCLAFTRPGWALTRHVIAIAQMLMGALFIHLTGGRIETHFHVFGSLAFLAFYRDWRVLITASTVVVVDHLVRGLMFPQSVFGVLAPSPWRWLEHGGWVLFEDCFLIGACRRSIEEMRAIAERQAALQQTNTEIERIVDERTQQLRESQQRTVQIIDTANDAFIGMDGRGRVTEWNHQAETVFGWSREEALGQLLADLIIPASERGAHEHAYQRLLDHGALPLRNKRTDVLAMHRDGHTFPVEVTVWSVVVGQTVRFNAFIHDITQRKQAEQALRHAAEAAESANRAKSEFLANMSHEIRTPMGGILGMVQLALETELTVLQREYLEMAHRSAESLLTILNDILDFSKIETGKLELNPVLFSLRDCLGNLMKDLSVRARGKSLELTYLVESAVPDLLVGDPIRLRQVLMNLVGNAIKFTDTGEISVEVKASGGRQPPVGDESCSDGCTPATGGSRPPLASVSLSFSVRDTGIGIPTDKRQTIFQVFEQADNSITRRFGGTGLGLPIASRLVALMGGRIEVDSQPGQGSTFRFGVAFGVSGGEEVACTGRLERRNRDTEGERPTPRPATSLLRGLSVLVVDDNATNRRLLNDLLVRWQMRPQVVGSAAEALAALRLSEQSGQPFALVLLDAMMPEVDGFQVAEQICQHPRAARAAVMMLSSAHLSEDAARCRALGVTYLTKPITRSDLFDAILACLGATDGGQGVQQTARQREQAGLPAEPIASRPLRILLAEDNSVNQLLARRLLEKEGHAVVTVENGQHAVARLETEPFDLVLMDVQMPEMDGLEATEAIRVRERNQADGHPGGRHIPIIAMTARAMRGDRERCLEAGMDGYISKPIERRELLRQIAQACASGASAAPADPPNQEPAPQPLDREAALARLEGDVELLGILAQAFLQDWPNQIEAIRQALAGQDAERLRLVAHSLRGAASLLGAGPTGAAALRLEQAGQGRELETAGQVFTELQAQLDRLRPILEDLAPHQALGTGAAGIMREK